MTPAGLSAKIKQELDARFPDPVPGFEGGYQDFCDAIGTAVVEYIQANAVVTSSVAVASVSGVTPGGGSSGSGTGTATGTVG
jgi:hypothetical protein